MQVGLVLQREHEWLGSSVASIQLVVARGLAALDPNSIFFLVFRRVLEQLSAKNNGTATCRLLPAYAGATIEFRDDSRYFQASDDDNLDQPVDSTAQANRSRGLVAFRQAVWAANL